MLKAIKEVYEQFHQLRAEVTEYKKSVNNAFLILSKELLDFTEKDVAERRERQRRQDIKDVVIGCFLLLTVVVCCSIISVQVYLLYR